MTKLQISAVVACVWLAPVMLAAGQADAVRPTVPPRATQPLRAPQPQAPPQVPQTSPLPLGAGQDGPDARETRDRLRQVLEKYPSSVREVLQIDPSLMTRADYLQSYPMLWAFLEQHPEVAHNPAYFLGRRSEPDGNDSTPRSQGYRFLENIANQFVVLLVVMTITAGLLWLVRSLAEHLRWQRAWRAQSTLNTKLIDRFQSSEELLAYLQSPAGRGLTEMPALPQASVTRGMTAPLGRIFWSMQAGTVLIAAGFGLIFIGSRNAIDPEAQSVFAALGTFVLTVGLGFVISSGISYFLSHKLGLIQPMAGRYNSEVPGA
jgi:hypothetical protein